MNISVTQNEFLVLQKESAIILQSLTTRVDAVQKDPSGAEKLFGVEKMDGEERGKVFRKATLVGRAI